MGSSFKLEWIETYLQRGPRVIMDIGCFDCEDSLRFKAAYPDCRVIAFEASGENFKQLLARYFKSQLNRIEIHHCAICDRTGTAKFRTSFDDGSGETNSGSMLEPNEREAKDNPHLKFGDAQEVPCMTVNEFCTRNFIPRIDVVHMDIQGAEWYALKGFGSFRPNMIFLEVCETHHYDGAKPYSELSALLIEMGYFKQWGDGQDELWIHIG